MAIKLSAAYKTTLQNHIIKLRDKWAAVEKEVEAANAEIKKMYEDINYAIAEYNDELNEASAWVEEVVNTWQAEFDTKSEKWQEGEKGSTAADMISEWDGQDLSAIDLLEQPEIDIESPDHADSLEALPTDIEG